jgi:hypothetical protein
MSRNVHIAIAVRSKEEKMLRSESLAVLDMPMKTDVFLAQEEVIRSFFPV